MMKILLLLILVFSLQGVMAQKGQLKREPIYYLLDTIFTPIKDRMWEIQREGSDIAYVLKCKCYPLESNPVFSSRVSTPRNIKNISSEEFKELKLISITQLIEILVKYVKDKTIKNDFYFVKPEGTQMKVIKVHLMEPRNPSQGSSIDYEVIKPVKN